MGIIIEYIYMQYLKFHHPMFVACVPWPYGIKCNLILISLQLEKVSDQDFMLGMQRE